MRKLRGASAVGGMGSSSTGSIDDATGGTNPQHTALGLMHLKKLFSEYTHPPHQLSETDRNDKLYNMLPLFCKASINHGSILLWLLLILIFAESKSFICTICCILCILYC